jgi:hypothetical protein
MRDERQCANQKLVTQAASCWSLGFGWRDKGCDTIVSIYGRRVLDYRIEFMSNCYFATSMPKQNASLESGALNAYSPSGSG